MPFKNWLQRSSWAVTISLVALTVFFCLYDFIPGRRATKQRQAELQQKRDYIARSTQLTTETLAIEQQIAETCNYIQHWHERSTSAAATSDIFGQINALIKTAGAEATRFEPEPVQEYRALRRIPLFVGFTGTFAQTYEVLRAIERLDRLIWIDQLKFEKKSEDASDVECQINMVIFADKFKISD